MKSESNADYNLDRMLREDLWTAIRNYTNADAKLVTEACAAAWEAVRKVIPMGVRKP